MKRHFRMPRIRRSILWAALTALLAAGIPTAVVGLGATEAVAASMCSTTPGTVCAWGQNNGDELGNGTTKATYSPTIVPGLTNVISISASSADGKINHPAYALALRVDGTVWGWGEALGGMIGNPTAIYSKPIQISFLSKITAIVAAPATSYALRSDGTVWQWGSIETASGNSFVTTPSQVPGLSGVIALAGGVATGYALEADGSVWAWGYGGDGELGNGSTATTAQPVQVSNLSGIQSITASSSTAYAVRDDGTVWSWGLNGTGALGAGDFALQPVQISGLTGITSVATSNSSDGAGTTYALRSDGTVWAWGDGYFGQLGNGQSGSVNGADYNSPTPVQVHNLTGAVAIGAGALNGYAVLSTGSVWAWGSSFDALGDGSKPSGTGATALPVKVKGLNYPEMVAGSHSGYAIVGSTFPSADTYVALGDSYSSGEGAPDPGFLRGTDQSNNLCHRSAAAYPELVAKKVHSTYPNFIFRACSGATLNDFPEANVEGNANEPPQLSWLGNTTGLVTLTIGGNNANFADVMYYCATRFSGDPSCEDRWSAQVDGDIAALGSTLDMPGSLIHTFNEIRQAAPQARVLVLGYPRLFPVNPPQSCATGAIAHHFQKSDMLWLNSEAQKLDGVLQWAAQQSGFTFVPMYNVFDKHEVCTSDPYLNRAIASLSKSVQDYSFHPKIVGQKAMARVVEQYLKF